MSANVTRIIALAFNQKAKYVSAFVRMIRVKSLLVMIALALRAKNVPLERSVASTNNMYHRCI